MPETLVKNYKYFNRGVYSKPQENELALDNENRKKVTEYDFLLRKFRYGEVLDLAFETQRSEITLSIIQELVLRNGLKDALAGRDSLSICKVILWISAKIHNPKFSSTDFPLCALVVDMYSALASVNAELLEAFRGLLKEVEEEYLQQTLSMQVVGIVDFLMQE